MDNKEPLTPIEAPVKITTKVVLPTTLETLAVLLALEC